MSRPVAIICGVVLSILATPTRAQMTVSCVNCSTIWDQAIEIGHQVEAVAEAVQTKLNTLYTLQNLAQMAERLPSTVYQTVTGPVRAITGMGSQMRYGGGYGIPNLMAPISSVTSYAGLLDQQTRQIGYSLGQLKSIFETHDDQMQSSVKNLEDLEGQARGLDSRNGILQTMAGIDAANGQATIAHQAAQSAASQATLTMMAAQQQRESYVVMRSSEQETAGIRSMCAAAGKTGITVPSPACQGIAP